MISKTVSNIRKSATIELTRTVASLEEQGQNIIKLNVGEPDFETPENIVKAGCEAITGGKTKYTTVNGISELRKAICSKLSKDNGLDYSPEEIVVSTGAKQALFNSIISLAGKGDEVIIPTPCWVSYIEMVKLASAKPVLVKTDAKYHLDIDAISKAVTDKTKAIIINNPCNPTGAVFASAELKKLVKLAIEHRIYVISDEVYEKLNYTGKPFVSVASVSKEAKDYCVIINGFSKAYAMTGWRIGYSASNRQVAGAISTVQGHTTSNSTTFVQWAALEALTGPQKSVKTMVREFDRRRIYLYGELCKIKGFRCKQAQGAFYLFPDVSYYFGKKTLQGDVIKNSDDFCLFILRNAKVALVPGSAFREPDCVRISYSNSMTNLKKAVKAIKNSLNYLR